MIKRKEYNCCICNKLLDYKPIRLVKQLYDNKETYGAYHNMHNYDFCIECYEKLEKVLNKKRIKK